jgi:predicted metal-binding protein
MIRKISCQDLHIEYCKKLGVSDVRIIPASKISVEEQFAEICKNDRCPGYGSAPSCPPYVMSSKKFKDIISSYHSALIFKFEIPTSILFGNERNEVLYLLHETASAMKDFSLNNGYIDAMAIAAGSCKQIFCERHNACTVITDSGKCRHPKKACPSMSGLGVNFNKISKLLGWDKDSTKKNEEPTSNMVGIVLLKHDLEISL